MKYSKSLKEPFEKALEGYNATYMGTRNLATRSRVEYETDVIQFLCYLWSWGVRNFKKISPGHIRYYLSKLDKEGLSELTRRRRVYLF